MCRAIPGTPALRTMALATSAILPAVRNARIPGFGKVVSLHPMSAGGMRK